MLSCREEGGMEGGTEGKNMVVNVAGSKGGLNKLEIMFVITGDLPPPS